MEGAVDRSDNSGQTRSSKATNTNRRTGRSSTNDGIAVDASPVLGKQKRKRSDSEEIMSRNKKGHTDHGTEDIEIIQPTNAQIMQKLNKIGNQFEALATKQDLSNVERDLERKLCDNRRELHTELQTEIQNKLSMHGQEVKKLIKSAVKEELETAGAKNTDPGIVRKEAQAQRKLKARRSLRLWPITTQP